MVPRFVHDCIQLMVTPLDGDALTVALHSRGINMRYLGRLAKLAALRDDLHHLLVSEEGGNGVTSYGLICLCVCVCDSVCA